MRALLTLAVATQALGAPDDAKDVVLSLAFWRHGDRSPTQCFPTQGAECAEWWLDGFGMLSPTGMGTSFSLGSVLRERYNESAMSTNGTYRRELFHVQSTDFDRTLMTAQSVTTGLFPPGSGPLQRSGQPALTSSRLQPLPIHSAPQSIDVLLLAYQSSTCPAVTRAQASEKAVNAAQWAVQQTRLDAVRSIVKSATGLPDSALTIDVIYAVWDVLVCNAANGHPAPGGLNASVQATLQEVADFTLAHLFATREQQRLSAGRMIYELISRMNAAAAGDPQPGWSPTSFPAAAAAADPRVMLGPFLWGYSCHDTTLAGLMIALRAYPNIHPPYSSSVVVELVNRTDTLLAATAQLRRPIAQQQQQQTLAVRAYFNQGHFRNNTFSAEQRLPLPCASAPASAAMIQAGMIGPGECLLSDFVTEYSDVAVNDQQATAACAGPTPTPAPTPSEDHWSGTQIGVAAGASVAGVLVGAVVAVLYSAWCLKSKPTAESTPILPWR